MAEKLTYHKQSLVLRGNVSDEKGNVLYGNNPFGAHLSCREGNSIVDAGDTWKKVMHAFHQMPGSFETFMFKNSLFKTIKIPVEVSPLEVQCQTEIRKRATPSAPSPAR